MRNKSRSSYTSQPSTSSRSRRPSFSPETEQHQKNSLHQQFFRRLWLATLLFCLGFAGLSYRAYDLQVQRSSNFRKMIQASQVATLRLSARRGTIYDRNMAPLALSVEVNSIGVNPRLFRHKLKKHQRRKLARQLAHILHRPLRSIQRTLEQDTFFSWLKRHISPREHEALKRLKIDFALRPSQEPRRFYPNSFLAAHILGHTDIDGRGLAGVEHVFDRLLRGKSQTLRLPHDTKGRHILVNPNQLSRRGRPGANLVLTLDKTIQYHTETELAFAVHKFQAKRGIAIVMNPNNGDVLSLAVYPTFNPNKFHQTKPNIRNNWAITSPYEPGSTLKVLTIAVARELKVIGLHKRMDCENGRFRIGRYTIRDDHPKKHPLTPKEVLKYSSNICTAKIAFLINKYRLYKYFRKFGLGQRTKIGIAGESRGLFSRPRRWARISTANIAFGQGIAVTPIQLITAISAIANGGVLFRPRLYKAITDANGRTIRQFPIKKVRRVISRRASREVRNMMAAVVKSGTGRNAAIEGISVAGKTGTAQKPAKSRRGYGKGRIGSFVGFVPTHNPRLAILVVIDEPKKSKYGGTVAAPAWKRIAIASLQHLGEIPSNGSTVNINQFGQPAPTLPTIQPKKHKPSRQGSLALHRAKPKTQKEKRPSVPSLLGLEWTRAHHKARRLGLRLRSLGAMGRGYARYQRPSAGSPLPRDRELTVIFR